MLGLQVQDFSRDDQSGGSVASLFWYLQFFGLTGDPSRMSMAIYTLFLLLGIRDGLEADSSSPQLLRHLASAGTCLVSHRQSDTTPLGGLDRVAAHCRRLAFTGPTISAGVSSESTSAEPLCHVLIFIRLHDRSSRTGKIGEAREDVRRRRASSPRIPEGPHRSVPAWACGDPVGSGCAADATGVCPIRLPA